MTSRSCRPVASSAVILFLSLEGVFRYCSIALRNLPMFRLPPDFVLPRINLVADFSATSARSFDLGKCADDVLMATPQLSMNLITSSQVKMVPPSVEML